MIPKQTLDYVTIEDVCLHNNLDVNSVYDAISWAGDISYGTNSDTFISGVRLENITKDILGKTLSFDTFDKTIMISLGC